MGKKKQATPIESPCSECRSLGGDYYIDENGELQDFCTDCRFNETKHTDHKQTKKGEETKQ